MIPSYLANLGIAKSFSKMFAPTMLESLMSRVFQGLNKNELIHANWYSGKLLIIGLYDQRGRLIGRNPPDISRLVSTSNLDN